MALWLTLFFSCNTGSPGNTSDESSPDRSFYMGFTPWPYAATLNAIEDTYDKINNHGDIIDHHFQTGIPWQAAYEGNDAYKVNIDGDINDRYNKTGTGKTIYLALDCLNAARNDLAPYWDDNFNEPMSGHTPWDSRDFDSPEVIDAYVNFSKYLIDKYNPRYFNYATEISELILNDADKYEKFQTFASAVYTRLKAAYPDLTVLVSVALKHPQSTDAAEIVSEMGDISACYDMLGISVYPYAFYYHEDSGDPAEMPSRWLSQASDIAREKPMAITETAWLAENLNMDAPYNFSRTGSEEWQNEYLEALFPEANRLNIQFIIWFSVVDYNALWSDLLKDEVSKIWRDTGLYDENLTARSALTTWDSWLGRSKNP